MPIYQITAPNGVTYQTEGPPNATPEQIKAVILAAHPEAAKGAEGGGFLDTAADVAKGLVRGAGTTIGKLGSELVSEAPRVVREGLAQSVGAVAELGALRSPLLPQGMLGTLLSSATRTPETQEFEGQWAQGVAPAAQAVQRAGKAVETSVAPRTTPSFAESEGFWGGLGSLAVTAAESATPTLAALATTAATRNPNLGLAVMGTLSVPQTYSGIREQQKKQGIDDVGKALIGTAASSAFDLLTGTGGAISKLGKEITSDVFEQGLKRAVTESLKTGRAEAGTEMLQNVIEQVAGGADPTTKDNLMQTLESGLVGALMGTSVGLASEKINAARAQAAREAAPLHTVNIMRVSPTGEEVARPLDILSAPDKSGAVVVRDTMGNIQTVTLGDIEEMQAPALEGEAVEPLRDVIEAKVTERKDAYAFAKAAQDVVKDPTNQSALDIVADRYAKLYGVPQAQAMQYAKASIAQARGEAPPVAAPTAAPSTEEIPMEAREFAPPEASGVAPAAPVAPPAAMPGMPTPEQAMAILDDTSGEMLREYADSNGIDMDEAADRLTPIAGTGVRYMRGRPRKDQRAQAEAAGQESLFGAMPTQAESRLSKAEELTQRKLELTPEERVAQQEEVSAAAQQRIEAATQRNQELEAQRLDQAQEAIHNAHPANAGYEVRRLPDSPTPYQVVGPEEADGTREVFVAAKNLNDFEEAVGDLPPYTPRPLSAQAVEGGREVPDTPYTQINRELVDEVTAARNAGKITQHEQAMLMQQIADTSNRKAIDAGESAYRNAMTELRSADSDFARRAAEIKVNDIAQDLRRVVGNVVANPVRARLKSILEGRAEEKIGARMRVENAKVQETLGRMEGANVAPELREQREAGIDIAEATPSRYMRGEKAPGGAPTAVAKDEVQRVVNAITAGWRSDVPVNVVNSAANLPAEVQRAIEADGAKDAFAFVTPNGSVYILADNLTAIEDARAALFHEALGHLGLASLFRSTLDTALVDMYNANAKLQGEVDAWRKDNPDAYARDPNPLARATEEVLAERSEAGQLDTSLLRKIATIVRNFARRMGFKVSFTDSDVAATLSMAHDRVVRGPQKSAVVQGLRYLTTKDGLARDVIKYMTPKKSKGEAKAEEKINRGALKAQLSAESSGMLDGLTEASEGHIEAAKEAFRNRKEALETLIQPANLAVSRTDTLRDMIDKMNPYVGAAVKGLDRIEQQMRGMSASMEKALSRRIETFEKFVNKYKQDVISGMMTTARVNRVDVTEANNLAELLKNDKVAQFYRGKTADKSLKLGTRSAFAKHLKNRESDIRAAWEAWEKLGKQPGGQELYKQLRQFYKDMYTAIRSEQDEDIRGLGLDAESEERLIKLAHGEEDIDTDGDTLTDETDRSPGVPQKFFPEEYFPFRRFGEYVLTVNPPNGERERYHFETPLERNQWESKRAKQLGVKRGDEGYGQVFKQYDGRDTIRADYASESAMLREMFKIIDSSPLVKGFNPSKFTTQQEANDAAKVELKDKLYQTYLMTLPERSLRKQFIHAEKITGNSADALRIFKNAASQYKSMLPKLAYGRDVQRLIETANETIGSDDPHNDAMLRTLLNTYVDRYRETINPTNGPGKWEQRISSFTFLQMMSSVYSAALQPISIPMQVMPRMVARYNPVQTFKVMDSYLPVWGAASMFVDVDPATGEKSFTAPSLGNTPTIQNSPLRKRLWEELNDKRDLFSQKHTNMMMRDRKTKVYGTSGLLNRAGNAYEQAVHFSGALISSADQLAREVTGMTFAELHYNKLRKEGVPHEEAVADAVEAAIRNTDETLGNYTNLNKPDIFKGGPIRRMFGYLRTYSSERTSYYLRQWDAITKDSPYQTRWQAFNELTSVLLLSALGAGVKGVFGYSILCGLIDLWLKATLSDEEKEKRRRENPLGAESADYRFRNQWIPYHFGSDSAAANVLRNGFASEMTGADLGPRISQNDLWIREGKDAKTTTGTVANFLSANFSPQLSQAMQLGDALDAFKDGNISRGLSKSMPAVVRGFFTAERLGREGEIQPQTGRMVMAPQEFTQQDLINQRLGAVPLKLAKVREQNRALIDWQKGMETERAELMTAARKAIREGDQESLADIGTKIQEHNRKVPYGDLDYIIQPQDIMQSITSSATKAGKSVRGVELTPAERMYLRQ